MELDVDQTKKPKTSWKDKLPLSPFHLMDIENGYFLPKFNNKLGYKKVLSKVSWITFGQYLRLSRYMYKHKILLEIEGLVVYVNLDKPLVSQILINGNIQKDEFLPMVCFHCGRYGHMKDVCPFRVFEPRSGKHPTPSKTLPEVESININDSEETSEIYEP
ncbi:hypothetical protein Goklo_004623 [Gossypium klotzschianum]|uniref:CCHC-type domain-containing protein n=1 Tax=Gossypium klotzschianum TaxID=34286 RepID=A0A7J8VPB6_9ROSI|nr:hypothetical protein [Gossypium klotzschianum]